MVGSLQKSPFDVESPLAQAGRCLDLWLGEESLFLDPRHRKRTAALIARYFHNEEVLSDQLILSFLRHFSGFGEVDLDDAGAVRREIGRLLKTALPRPGTRGLAEKDSVGNVGIYVSALILGGLMIAWGAVGYAAGQPVTLAEVTELRLLVARVVDVEKAHGMTTVSHQKVWSELKKPLAVSRYQDMSRADYRASRRLLETRLERLETEGI